MTRYDGLRAASLSVLQCPVISGSVNNLRRPTRPRWMYELTEFVVLRPVSVELPQFKAGCV